MSQRSGEVAPVSTSSQVPTVSVTTTVEQPGQHGMFSTEFCTWNDKFGF